MSIALVREVLRERYDYHFPHCNPLGFDGINLGFRCCISPLRSIMTLAAGALLVIGYLKALLNYYEEKKKDAPKSEKAVKEAALAE
ncbi:hypothetical protein [Marispirochaeta aestuarii]|uniref:hypothetical protein n=1 Tax=Marispirochaeta aestuarii TaxID=1963862 RepID=UPI003749EEFD